MEYKIDLSNFDTKKEFLAYDLIAKWIKEGVREVQFIRNGFDGEVTCRPEYDENGKLLCVIVRDW